MFKDRYGLLPSIPEHVAEELSAEVEKFATLVKHDPEGARKSVSKDIEWLNEHKDFLGRAVKASVDSALELYGDKLTYEDWTTLELFLLKGFLLVLQGINKAMEEKL